MFANKMGNKVIIKTWSCSLGVEKHLKVKQFFVSFLFSSKDQNFLSEDPFE